MRENTDRKISKYGHFSRSEGFNHGFKSGKNFLQRYSEYNIENKQKAEQKAKCKNKQEQKAEGALWEVMCTYACKHKSKNLLRCNVVQRKFTHAAFGLLCIVD